MNEFNDRKVIRNRQVVREVDHDSTLELRWFIVVGLIFAGLVCVYNWQQHRMVEYGYRAEEIKKETAQIIEARKKLHLEHAMLESPARIYRLAHERLGFRSPGAHQILFERLTSAGGDGLATALAWNSGLSKSHGPNLITEDSPPE